MTSKACWLSGLIALNIGHAAPALRLFSDPAQPISPVAISEDAAGFLWIAADQGVFRFDGSHFAKIPGEFKGPAGIAVIGGNAVLVAANNGVFEYRDGVTTRLSPEPANSFCNLTGDLVLVLHTHPTANWIEAAEWDGKRTKLVPQRERSGWAWLSRDGSLWQMCGRHPCSVQNTDELRTAIRAGDLKRYVTSKAEVLTAVTVGPEPHAQGPQGFLKGANGDYIWRTEFTGIVSVIQPGRSARQFHVGEFTRANGRPGLYADRSNRVWIPGDYLWISEAGGVRRFRAPQIEGIQVNCVFEDAARRIWLGLNGRGLAVLGAEPYVDGWVTPSSAGEINSLMRYSPSMLFATTTKGELLRKRGESDWEAVGLGEGGPQLSQVARAADSTLVGLIRLGPPARLSPAGQILSRFLVDPGAMVSSFRRLVAAPDGTFFVGSLDGLYRIGGNRLEEIHLPVPDGNAQDIVFDRTGRAWVAFQGGICKVEGDSCIPAITNKDGLVTSARSLGIGAPDEAWVAYREPVGFSRFRYTNGRWTARHFTAREGFESTETQFLRRDQRGWVWRGTDRSGLWISDGVHTEPGDWVRISEREGLPSPAIHRFGFLEDGPDSVWIGTARGIARVRPDPAWFSSAQPLRIAAIRHAGKSWIEPSRFPRVFEAPAEIAVQVAGMSLLPLRYRLRPREAVWRVSRTGELQWTRLEAGRYELEATRGSGGVVARYPFEVKLSTGARLRMPALLAVLIAALAGLAGVIAWRKKRAAGLRPLPDLTEARLEVLLPEAQRLIGAILDERFAIESIVARGGFSTVSRATDLRDGSQCAIKVFREEFGDDWFSRHFLHEVAALEAISHPNIVRVCGHGRTPNGCSYLAMEFIEGCTLRDLLDRGSLQRERCAMFLRQIGGALDEIHSHRIFHRDVKPENLMIRGGSEELVLIDFGMAIVQDPDRSVHGLSRAGGTLHYMAPEQVLGCASAESDIYSLAKVTIEMMAGQKLSILLPDAALDLPERVRKLLAGMAFPLPSSSIEMLSAALEFDPSRRPRSALALVQEIACPMEAGGSTGRAALEATSGSSPNDGGVAGE